MSTTALGPFAYLLHTFANAEDGTAASVIHTPRGYGVRFMDTDAEEMIGDGIRFFAEEARAVAYAKTLVEVRA